MRDMLTRFSDRCIERLTGRPPIAMGVSVTSAHLRDNVEKEITKDCLVIEHAVQTFSAGREFSDADLDRLFERSKAIDREFLDQLVLPSVCINIRYDDIEKIRKKRFRYLAEFVVDLLQYMDDAGDMEEAVRSLFTAEQFRGVVGEFLFLYCVEVKKLTRSVRFLPPFSRAMDAFVDELVEAMEASRQEIASMMTESMFPAVHRRARRAFSAKFGP